MITPRSPSSSGSTVARSAPTRRIRLKLPIRLILMTRSKSASGMGPSRPTMRLAGPMPAQLTRMRAGPCAWRACATAATALSESATSQPMAMPPAFSATARAPSRLTSRTATLAPACASASAAAAPSPEPPPVTIAACPLMSMEVILEMNAGGRIRVVRSGQPSARAWQESPSGASWPRCRSGRWRPSAPRSSSRRRDPGRRCAAAPG